MALTLVITDAGRAALVNAARDGTNAVRVARVGVSPTAIVAGKTTAALPGEIKRIDTISGGAVAPDVIHLTVRDESDAVYTVRSFALYLTDGTLFASYGQATPILEKSAAALLLLALDVTLVDVSAAAVTFANADFINPPATIDRAGVVELATNAEAEAGADATRALTPANITTILAAAKILQRLLTVDGAGSGLDADLLDGRQGSEFALLSGAAFAGGLSAPTLSVAGATGQVNIFDRGFPLDPAHGWRLFSAADQLRFQSPVGTAMTLDPFAGLDVVTLTVGGQRVWNAGNDGAGSGLDADLLDGRQGLEFALLAGSAFTGAVSTPTLSVAGPGSQINVFDRGFPFDAAHGWRIFSSADQLQFQSPNGIQLRLHPFAGADFLGITRGGNAVWGADNDGSGSGADADLLDGQQGAWYADIAARLGYMPLRQSDIADIWRASNDGSGSGLDADLLDGWHADTLRSWGNLLDRPASFPPSAHGHAAADIAGAFASQLLGANGYQVLPGGLILQWVAGASNPARSETTQFVAFPLNFPNACLRAFATVRIPNGTTAADAFYQIIGDPAPSGVTIQRQVTGSPDDNVSTIPLIFAIGF